MRPPSRQKSPPRALGLEIPGSDKLNNSKIKIKSFQKRRPNTSKSTKLDLGDHEGFGMTNTPNLETEHCYSIQNDQFDSILLCKTDEDELQLEGNYYISPILNLNDKPKPSNQK